MKAIRLSIKHAPNDKLPYHVGWGQTIMKFANRRKAATYAEETGKAMTMILFDINTMHMELLLHLRRCWMLDAPFVRNMQKSIGTIELQMDFATNNRHISLPYQNLSRALELIDQHIETIECFYRKRNHSALASELKLTRNRIVAISNELQLYDRRIETFLFSK